MRKPDPGSVIAAGFQDIQLRLVRLKHEGGPLVQIDVGGSLARHPEVAGELRRIVKEHLGEDAAVRLTYRHETVVR